MQSLKVFISSVIKGYEDKREAVKKAIYELQGLDFPIRPVMAEDFPALNKSPQKACKDGVLDSDIYIGILGFRYGWINPEFGLSATHEEYRTARNNGKQILIFIEDCDKEPRQREFVQETEDYLEGKFRRTSSNAEELTHEVHKALLRILAQRLKGEPSLYIASTPEMVPYSGGITPTRQWFLENLHEDSAFFTWNRGRYEGELETSPAAILHEAQYLHRQGFIELSEHGPFSFGACWTYKGLKLKEEMEPYRQGKVERILVFRVENQGGRRAEDCQADYELLDREGNRWGKADHRDYIGFLRSLDEVTNLGWGKDFLRRININAGDYVYLALRFPYNELKMLGCKH